MIVLSIIVEGCDCVGKTTLAEELSRVTGLKVVKGSSFEIAELGADGMFEHMRDLIHREDIIIDRFFYSNLVYGELFNYPMMNESQYHKLVKDVNELNHMVLYLHTSFGTILHRMNNRGDDMIGINHVDSILSKYKERLYGDFKPKMMLSLDTTSINISKEAKRIKDIHNAIKA